MIQVKYVCIRRCFFWRIRTCKYYWSVCVCVDNLAGAILTSNSPIEIQYSTHILFQPTYIFLERPQLTTCIHLASIAEICIEVPHGPRSDVDTIFPSSVTFGMCVWTHQQSQFEILYGRVYPMIYRWRATRLKEGPDSILHHMWFISSYLHLTR